MEFLKKNCHAAILGLVMLFSADVRADDIKQLQPTEPSLPTAQAPKIEPTLPGTDAPKAAEQNIDAVIKMVNEVPAATPATKAAKKLNRAKKPAVPKMLTHAASKARPEKPQGATKPLSAFELGRYQYCGDDKDCQYAVNGCCDCANGSEDVAVNKERYQAFRARFACLYVSCGESTSEPPCGTGVVSCVNHKCRYIHDGALEDKF